MLAVDPVFEGHLGAIVWATVRLHEAMRPPSLDERVRRDAARKYVARPEDVGDYVADRGPDLSELIHRKLCYHRAPQDASTESSGESGCSVSTRSVSASPTGVSVEEGRSAELIVLIERMWIETATATP